MFEKIKPWLASIAIVPVALYLLGNRGKYHLIDYFNLLVHEGGHGFFMFFGQFVYIAGGTLMQIILPSILIWYFYVNNYRFGTQLSLVWLAQNFINISVYAADARARALPLLGGGKVIHDWHFMLSRLGWLEFDHLIGQLFVGCAVVVFILAILVPMRMK